MYILGQSFGVIAAIISVFRPQFRRRKHILMCILLGNVFCTLNFFLIGKTGSAPFVCMVAIFQSVLALIHDRRNTEVSRGERLLFLALYLGIGLLGFALAEGFVPELCWKNALELMPIIGALMLMFSAFARDEQTTRLFLLFNGSIWLVYSSIVGSATLLANAVSVCSAASSLWRYRKKKK